MNFKIIVKNRLHKLPASVKTVQDLRASVKNLYKDKISNEFKLFVQLDQNSGELFNIETDEQMTLIKLIYQKEDWQSLKILVLDKNEELSSQDLEQLNQSMIHRKSTIKSLENQQQNMNDEKPLIRQFNTTDNHPEQHILPLNNEGIGAILEQKNLMQIIQPQNPVIDFQIPGVDPTKFEEYILKLVDLKLTQRGFLNPEQKKNEEMEPQPPQVEITEFSSQNINIEWGKTYIWTFKITNTGLNKWPENVKIVQLGGQIEGFSRNLKSLAPKESDNIQIEFGSRHPCLNESQIFQLCYFDGDKLINFGHSIGYNLTVRYPSDNLCPSNSLVFILSQTYFKAVNPQLLQRAQKIQEVLTQIPLDKIINILKSKDTKITDDELIIMLMNK